MKSAKHLYFSIITVGLFVLLISNTGCPPSDCGCKLSLDVLKSACSINCRGCNPCQEVEGEPTEGEMVEGEGESVEGELVEGEGETVEGEIVEGEGETVEGEPAPNTLTVIITPAEAITAGATWSLDGEGEYDSGAAVTNLTPGSHIISFSILAGWIKPVSYTFEHVDGQEKTETRNYTRQLKSTSLVVLGYSELGMHCMNEDFSEFMILPPYNTLYAQVIDRSHGSPEIMQSSISIRYEIPGNTESASKTNFWDYAEALFGRAVPVNVGLTGNQLTGTMLPEAAPRTDWAVTGIPITPIEDAGTENPYALAVITVSQGGTDIVQTQAVVPVSWEISCNICHNTQGISTATDILRKHDLVHGTNLEANKPVTCGDCHAQPALAMPGDGTSPSLSRAMHGSHASRMALVGDVSCYACHPGIRTQCQRDVHFSKGMNCISCHGQMTDVAAPERLPWVTEPRCETCHVNTAPAGYEFEQPNTLYRNSRGHRNIMCGACHGSPHAITPTVTLEDNVQAIAIQGHEGVINTCSVCHSEAPEDPFPHSVSGEVEGGEKSS